MRVAAILVAGGRGERAGAGQPKQFIDLGGGRTMVDLASEVLLQTPGIDEVIVAAPTGYLDRVRPRPRLRVVDGGRRRQDSMGNALASVSPDVDVILVHDAARPFVTTALVGQVIDAAVRYGAAIAAVPVADTVKRTRSENGARTIVDTLSREDLFLAQTPQAFERALLEQVIAAAGASDVTDEAMLVERAGIPVHIVPGEAANVKVTTAGDLERARQAVAGVTGSARRAEVTSMRVGTGYDLHRLEPNRRLVLAGVDVPFDRGLAGHSDADIVCHAVTDAILGAVAAGDIGALFPDSDPAWKDADSIGLLAQAVGVVRARGFEIVNVDVTVIAERPKLRPYVDRMRRNLATALGVSVEHVSVKGKTNETVDAPGRGEAMACHAVALLTSSPRMPGNAE